jgi:hypothetical protein
MLVVAENDPVVFADNHAGAPRHHGRNRRRPSARRASEDQPVVADNDTPQSGGQAENATAIDDVFGEDSSPRYEGPTSKRRPAAQEARTEARKSQRIYTPI